MNLARQIEKQIRFREEAAAEHLREAARLRKLLTHLPSLRPTRDELVLRDEHGIPGAILDISNL